MGVSAIVDCNRVKWAATLQLFLKQQTLQIGPMCTFTVSHFWLRISCGIKPWSTDLNSESLANITHRRNASIPYPAHSAIEPADMCSLLELWRWIKSNPYTVWFVNFFFHRRGSHKVNMREELLQRILIGARSINNPAVLRKATSYVVTQVRKCIQADGRHFEQLVWAFNGESVTVHLTTHLNKWTMLLFLSNCIYCTLKTHNSWTVANWAHVGVYDFLTQNQLWN